MTAIEDSSPSHGTLNFTNDGSFSYTPVNGYFGLDSFTYHTFDGLLNSLTAVVNLNVQNPSLHPGWKVGIQVASGGVAGSNLEIRSLPPMSSKE